MRTDRELLKILIERISRGYDTARKANNTGICANVTIMHNEKQISIAEWHRLRDIIDSNRKMARAKYGARIGIYWWPEMWRSPEYRQVRIDFLTEVLKRS